MKDYKKELENVLDTIRAFGEACPDNDLIQTWINVNFPSLKKSRLQRLKNAIFKALSKKEARDVLIREGFQVSEALDWLKRDEEPSFKFKRGDWVVNISQENVILRVVDPYLPENDFPYYTLVNEANEEPQIIYKDTLEKQYRLWSISDAKDGDFLAYPDGSIVIYETRYQDKDSGLLKAHALYLPEKDEIEINRTCCILNVTPATKDQKNLLLKKLDEKWYKWCEQKKSIIISNKPNIFYNLHWYLCIENFTHYDATIFVKGHVYHGVPSLGICDSNGYIWEFDQFQENSFKNYFKPVVNQNELDKSIKEEIINFIKNIYGNNNDNINNIISNLFKDV